MAKVASGSGGAGGRAGVGGDTTTVDVNLYNLLYGLAAARSYQHGMRDAQLHLIKEVEAALVAELDSSGAAMAGKVGAAIAQDVKFFQDFTSAKSSSIPAKSNKMHDIASLAQQMLGNTDNVVAVVTKYSEMMALGSDLPTLKACPDSKGRELSLGHPKQYWGTTKPTVFTYLLHTIWSACSGDAPSSHDTSNVVYSIDTGVTDTAVTESNGWLDSSGNLYIPHGGYTFGGMRLGIDLQGNKGYTGGPSYDCSSLTATYTSGVSFTTIDAALVWSHNHKPLDDSWKGWYTEDNNIALCNAYSPVTDTKKVTPGVIYGYNKAWNPHTPVGIKEVQWGLCAGHTGMVVETYDNAGDQYVKLFSVNRDMSNGYEGVGYQIGYSAGKFTTAHKGKAVEAYPYYLSAVAPMTTDECAEIVPGLVEEVKTWDISSSGLTSEQTELLVGVVDIFIADDSV